VLAGANAIGTRPAERDGRRSIGATSRLATAASCSRVIGTSGGIPSPPRGADGGAAIGTSRGAC
jgi:hypothetical protein